MDELKIDRSFVAGLLTLTEDAVLVRATIDLGHNLGMTVVAEGVEDEGTATVLRELGCDVAQGYHYARPLPPDAFAEWAAAARRSAQRPGDTAPGSSRARARTAAGAPVGDDVSSTLSG